MSFMRITEPNVADIALDDLGIIITQNTIGYVISNQFAVGDLVRSADLEAAIIAGDLDVELDYGTGFQSILAADYTNRDTLGTFLNVYEITNENNNEDLVDGSDVNASGPSGNPLHIHDARYYTETELGLTTGGTLIGVNDDAWDTEYPFTFTTLQQFIDGLYTIVSSGNDDLDSVYDSDADGIMNVDGTTKPLEFRSDSLNDIKITRFSSPDLQNALLFDVSSDELILGSPAVGGLNAIDVHILTNLTVDGDITFTGTITDTTVNVLNVINANVRLRDGATAIAATDAYIEVERGTTGADTQLFWNETTDRWQAGIVGNLGTIALLEFDEDVSGVWTFTGSGSTEPDMLLTDKAVATPPSTNLGSAGETPLASFDDGQLYTYDKTNSRNKWLSVSRSQIMFTGRNSANNKNEYLYLGLVNSMQTGFRIEKNSTILGITVEAELSSTYTIRIRKNNSLTNIASLVVTAATGSQTYALNVDVSQGDEIQAYLESSGNIEAPVVQVIYANKAG